MECTFHFLLLRIMVPFMNLRIHLKFELDNVNNERLYEQNFDPLRLKANLFHFHLSSNDKA